MSTWHQRQNPVQLWHETKFVLVEDPPEGMLCTSSYDTVEAALDQQTRTGGYILPPHAMTRVPL